MGGNRSTQRKPTTFGWSDVRYRARTHDLSRGMGGWRLDDWATVYIHADAGLVRQKCCDCSKSRKPNFPKAKTNCLSLYKRLRLCKYIYWQICWWTFLVYKSCTTEIRLVYMHNVLTVNFSLAVSCVGLRQFSHIGNKKGIRNIIACCMQWLLHCTIVLFYIMLCLYACLLHMRC